MKTAFNLIPLLALVACGGSETSTINPHGPCAQAIANYEENNNIAPTSAQSQDEFSVGNGNFRTFYVGVQAGEVQTAFFNWGADYEGCQATFN